MNRNLNRLVVTALFAALTCVATMIIKVPTVGTGGYVNIGDTIVLLSAWLIGGVYGGMAAGVGAALGDLFLACEIYMPATFIIKFSMAVAAYLIYVGFKKIHINKIIAYIVGGVVAEAIMVFGYFVYESIVLGYGLAAAASIAGNLIQGGTCLVLGLAAVLILEETKAVSLIKKYV